MISFQDSKSKEAFWDEGANISRAMATIRQIELRAMLEERMFIPLLSIFSSQILSISLIAVLFSMWHLTYFSQFAVFHPLSKHPGNKCLVSLLSSSMAKNKNGQKEHLQKYCHEFDSSYAIFEDCKFNCQEQFGFSSLASYQIWICTSLMVTFCSNVVVIWRVFFCSLFCLCYGGKWRRRKVGS